MANKFKVGDKVKIIRSDVVNELYSVEIGKISTINYVETCPVKHPYHLDNVYGSWGDNELQSVNFTKDDLQNGDVVTLHNGDKLVYLRDNYFSDTSENNNNELTDIYDLTDNLEYEYRGNRKREYDIVKVERPTYTTVYERDESVREMTLAEISEALGYEVKVVKEDR